MCHASSTQQERCPLRSVTTALTMYRCVQDTSSGTFSWWKGKSKDVKEEAKG